MPSPADIPQHLMDSHDKAPLIQWLSDLPIDFQTRQGLGVFWMRHTGTRLTLQDWKTISANTRASKTIHQIQPRT